MVKIVKERELHKEKEEVGEMERESDTKEVAERQRGGWVGKWGGE